MKRNSRGAHIDTEGQESSGLVDGARFESLVVRVRADGTGQHLVVEIVRDAGYRLKSGEKKKRPHSERRTRRLNGSGPTPDMTGQGPTSSYRQAAVST